MKDKFVDGEYFTAKIIMEISLIFVLKVKKV